MMTLGREVGPVTIGAKRWFLEMVEIAGSVPVMGNLRAPMAALKMAVEMIDGKKLAVKTLGEMIHDEKRGAGQIVAEKKVGGRRTVGMILDAMTAGGTIIVETTVDAMTVAGMTSAETMVEGMMVGEKIVVEGMTVVEILRAVGKCLVSAKPLSRRCWSKAKPEKSTHHRNDHGGTLMLPMTTMTVADAAVQALDDVGDSS